MARTAIAVQQIPKNSGAAVSFAAADSANGMSFPNDGSTVLRVKNGSGSPINVTVRAVPCTHGRSVDLVQAVAATTGDVQLGPFEPSLWNQGGGVGGSVNVDFSASTTVTVAAIKQ